MYTYRYEIMDDETARPVILLESTMPPTAPARYIAEEAVQDHYKRGYIEKLAGIGHYTKVRISTGTRKPLGTFMVHYSIEPCFDAQPVPDE